MNTHITEEDRYILDMLRELVWDAAELRDGMQMWEYDTAFRAALGKQDTVCWSLYLQRENND